MANKPTKKALLLSTLSMILCLAMLVGTTFAWFTDSVTSGRNTIKAGNLDVVLEYWNGTEYVEMTKDTALFNDAALWEPGHTEVAYLKVSNVGTLALKYNLSINVYSETPGINVNDEVFMLSDYIYMGVVESAAHTTFADGADGRNAAILAAEAADAEIISKGYGKSSSMLAKSAPAYLAVVVYMPTTVGNEANYKTGTNAPTITMGVELNATQMVSEEDFFGPDYDEGAAWVGGVDTSWYNDVDKEFTLTNAEELAGLAEIVNSGKDNFAGKTINLGADVDLNNVNWTPIGTNAAEGEVVNARAFVGTFDGNGYTVSNLKAVGEKAVGFFGKTYVGAHIEDLIIDGAYVSGNDYVGAILGQGYLSQNCIKNCTVTNATIIATPYKLADGTYDGGAKAGVIAGQAYNGNITGCVVKNATVIAYRDLGGIAGMLDFDGGAKVEASGNTVEKVMLSYIGVAGKYDGNKANQNIAAVVGRVGANAIVDETKNTVTDVTVDESGKGSILITTLDEFIKFAKDVNAGNTYAGKTVVLGANIDLANMEWTPIGMGDGFKGIFNGNGYTVSNLKITGNKSTVGLFANTYNGEIKNLTVENALVSGRLNVGVVAGNPYTSKFTNVTVKGHVEVNGLAYVGGVGGKNAYANWTNVTVAADDTSYVKAISTENGTAYRTYVGGVVGFNGEGTHTFKDITSNIDVIGDVCDIGGAFGIAHYGNKFENITVTGDVTNLISAENDGDDAATDVLETGLIAGVWHNQNGTFVSFDNISATGSIKTPNVIPASAFANNGLIGKAYDATLTGVLIIDGKDADGKWAVTDAASLEDALNNGGEVKLYKDVAAATQITVPAGKDVKIDLNGKTVKGNVEKNVGHVLRNEGSLTLVGGIIVSTANNGGSAIYNAAGASLVIEGTVIKGAPKTGSSWPSYAINSYGELTINNVEITSNHGSIALYGDTVINNATVTMNGIGGSSHVFYVGGDGTDVVINNGTYTHNGNVDGSLAYIMTGATVTINGGTFSASNGGYGLATYTGTLNVNGGTFANAFMDWGGPISITGGTFATKPADKHVAAGYKATKAGDKYIVAAENTAVIPNDSTAAGTLDEALNNGNDAILSNDLSFNVSDTTANSGYGATGVRVEGNTLDGNGNTLTVKGANGTWDSAVNITSGTIKNLTINSGFRGVFVGSSKTGEKVYLENVAIDGSVYTISCDQGSNQGLEATNCTFNGWTSYAATIGDVKFTDCSFGEGSGYAFCRPYAPTEFVGCDFAEGYMLDARAAVSFENCTLNGVALTADNISTLVIGGLSSVTVK